MSPTPAQLHVLGPHVDTSSASASTDDSSQKMVHEAIGHMRSVLRTISGAHWLPGAAIGAALIGSVWVGDCPIGEPRVCMSTFSQHPCLCLAASLHLRISHALQQGMHIRHVSLSSATLAGVPLSGRLGRGPPA